MKCSIQLHKNITFGTGLTKKTAAALSQIQAQDIADEFKRVYKIDADFKNNSTVASCATLCADIFESLSKHLGLPLDAVPRRLRVYTPDDLIKPSKTGGFCIPDSKKVLKSELPFELRSIFFMQNKLSAEDINQIAEEMHSDKLVSSPHFLRSFIHEWAHNVHLDNVYKKFGYEGNCPYGKSLYQKAKENTGIKVIKELQEQTFTPKEQEIIADTIGEYAATSNPFEVVAETYAKLIGVSLDDTTLLPKTNPFEGLGKMPKEFLTIFKRAHG